MNGQEVKKTVGLIVRRGVAPNEKGADGGEEPVK
jgi:hypothetical protein